MGIKYQEEVDRGVELLNKLYPAWIWCIDLYLLETGDSSTCILVQCFGDFLDGLWSLGLTREQASEYGFEMKEPEGAPENWEELAEYQEVVDQNYRQLDALWVSKILELRSQAS